MSENNVADLIVSAVIAVAGGALSAYLAKKMIDAMDVSKKDVDAAKKQYSNWQKKFEERTGKELKIENNYEAIVMQDVIDPDDIHTSFDDIAGIDNIKQELQDMIILPLSQPQLFISHSLFTLPKGVLLYGPPGTGKTMLAKALAKESGIPFINLQLSTLMNMYFGESQKLIRALFSMCRKLAPCILFIDEVDIFLSSRGHDNQEANAQMKSEFLQLWDGMLSEDVDNKYGIVVVGATNRPWDIDKAFLRRLPCTFLVDLPTKAQRAAILRLILKNTPLAERDCIEQLAEITEAYSGSDLKELCKTASVYPIREMIDQKRKEGVRLCDIDMNTKVRCLGINDFKRAMQRVQATGKAAYSYSRSTAASSFIDAILNHGVNKDEEALEEVNDNDVE
ncbi:ATPase [Blastocystis sp. ATCC 50177/Nand II]|uniref:ATPase n=1 Tax=Blastocystis sp. subtype 1 (strain ATCC 50177 / NandII) TaxID=478820 RepID=A0A196SCZ7_BLAHN|nr:ATPase [Blastocystis sp. ATCC 50177/Nand II]